MGMDSITPLSSTRWTLQWGTLFLQGSSTKFPRMTL
jgi:hypothetical protein